MAREAYITGIGMSEVGIRLTRSPLALTMDAIKEAVADAGLHGLLLVGHRVMLAPGTDPQALAAALAGLRLKLYGNQTLRDQGVGANVLDGPLQALLHFVQALRSTPGAPLLAAGDVITTGTVTDAHPVRSGEAWHSEISADDTLAAQLQGLTVRFS